MISKQEIRNQKLAERRTYVDSLTKDQKEEISFTIAQRVLALEQLIGFKVIGSYIPLKEEVDVSLLNNLFSEGGQQVAYPRVTSEQTLSFRCPDQKESLELGPFGITQPKAHFHEVFPEAYLIPLVAFDSKCHRVGYGKGHYDRYLSAVGNVLAIGIAYDMQAVDMIPADDFDQQLDYVVTEKRVYRAKA